MKYFNFSVGFLVCLIGFSLNGRAQELKVEAKLDKSTILMGDQTVLRLSATLPVKASVDFPALADTISSKVQIVKIGKTDTVADKNNPGMHVITRPYTITSFDPGLQMIPSMTFKSKTGNFNTAALPLQVSAVKVDTTKAIYDIKEPLSVAYSWMDWLRDHWHWVVISLFLVALIVGGIYYFRKKRGLKPAVIAIKPSVPAHQLALEKLYALREQKLWQQEEVKRYHSELTDVIREYLEKRYRIKAMEQTSEEIFAGLKHLEIAEQNRNSLRQILMLADLEKFAKEKPLNTDNEQSMDNAISFIKNTQEVQVTTENKEPQ